jgi:hypothetical protein
MAFHDRRIGGGPRGKAAAGLGFRLAYYAVLFVICGLMVVALYFASFLD